MQYGKERPDVVFDPRLAPVLQVKAAEIIASDTYATNCTLRYDTDSDTNYESLLSLLDLENIVNEAFL